MCMLRFLPTAERLGAMLHLGWPWEWTIYVTPPPPRFCNLIFLDLCTKAIFQRLISCTASRSWRKSLSNLSASLTSIPSPSVLGPLSLFWVQTGILIFLFYFHFYILVFIPSYAFIFILFVSQPQQNKKGTLQVIILPIGCLLMYKRRQVGQSHPDPTTMPIISRCQSTPPTLLPGWPLPHWVPMATTPCLATAQARWDSPNRRAIGRIPSQQCTYQTLWGHPSFNLQGWECLIHPLQTQ